MKSWRSTVTAYASAAAFVAVAALCRYLLSLIDPRILLFSSFYPAVLASALLFGFGPGAFSVVVSAAVTWYFFMPVEPLSVARVINLMFFAASGGLIAWIAAAYRNATDRLNSEQERRALLIDELRHRTKNAVAVAQSIISQTLSSDPTAARAINGRLRALFATNDLLTQTENRSATVREILADKIEPFGPERVTLSGPHIVLQSSQAQSLSIVIHELATNAAKYGSLSHDGGTLNVRWQARDQNLNIDWIEEGGPELRGEPERMGFGTTLIRSLTRSMGGTITKTWEPQGMTAKLTLPLVSA